SWAPHCKPEYSTAGKVKMRRVWNKRWKYCLNPSPRRFGAGVMMAIRCQYDLGRSSAASRSSASEPRGGETDGFLSGRTEAFSFSGRSPSNPAEPVLFLFTPSIRYLSPSLDTYRSLWKEVS